MGTAGSPPPPCPFLSPPGPKSRGHPDPKKPRDALGSEGFSRWVGMIPNPAPGNRERPPLAFFREGWDKNILFRGFFPPFSPHSLVSPPAPFPWGWHGDSSGAGCPLGVPAPMGDSGWERDVGTILQNIPWKIPWKIPGSTPMTRAGDIKGHQRPPEPRTDTRDNPVLPIPPVLTSPSHSSQFQTWKSCKIVPGDGLTPSCRRPKPLSPPPCLGDASPGSP